MALSAFANPQPVSDGQGMVAGSTELTTQDTGVAYRYYDTNAKDFAGSTIATGAYTLVTSDTTTWGSYGQETWYVVSGDGAIVEDRITVSGTVNLILCDGATLTAKQGIKVEGDNTLNIYAQSDGENAGSLLAGEGERGDSCAGIGGRRATASRRGNVRRQEGDESRTLKVSQLDESRTLEVAG